MSEEFHAHDEWLSDTSSMSSVLSDATLLEVKKLSLQPQETLLFEILGPVVLTSKTLDSWMMLGVTHSLSWCKTMSWSPSLVRLLLHPRFLGDDSLRCLHICWLNLKVRCAWQGDTPPNMSPLNRKRMIIHWMRGYYFLTNHFPEFLDAEVQNSLCHPEVSGQCRCGCRFGWRLLVDSFFL